MENHQFEFMEPINLKEHPEGGRFREIFRSKIQVRVINGKIRTALTHIYFSLSPNEISRFHRISSDEVWNLYQGDGVRLYLWDETENPPTNITLSSRTNCFCYIVPAGIWQAAEPIAGTVLVGCSVAPGFEYTDFELMDPESEYAQRLLSLAPELRRFTIPKNPNYDEGI